LIGRIKRVEKLEELGKIRKNKMFYFVSFYWLSAKLAVNAK
jgi:hypothetical protein